MKKHLALPLLLTSLLATTSAMAFGDKDQRMCHHGFGPSDVSPTEMINRKFSADEINTLVSARLLMHGNDKLTVGKVTATDTGYTAAIVTKKEKALVEEWQLAPNGMPLEMFEKMKKRMAEHSSK